MEVVVSLLIMVFVMIFIAKDSKKRGMSQGWVLIGLFNIIGLVIYLIARKPISVNNNSEQTAQNILNSPEQTATENISIPEICPQCKNPNTKRIRLCEWCGNQII